jgi:hypothetical protein
MTAAPKRGERIRIAWNATPKLKKPAFIGQGVWTVLGFDPKKGVLTKLGYYRSWIRA